MPVVFAQAGQWPGDLERRPHLSLPGAELRAGVDRLPNTCRQRHRAEEQSRQGWEEAGALRRSLTLGRGWTATEQAGEKPSEAPGARGEAEEGGNPTPVSHQRDGVRVLSGPLAGHGRAVIRHRRPALQHRGQRLPSGSRLALVKEIHLDSSSPAFLTACWSRSPGSPAGFPQQADPGRGCSLQDL